MTRTAITPGFNLVTGAYMGNGVDNRQIGCGFQPSLVIVKGDTAQYGIFRTADMPTDEAAYFFNGAANFANAIQSFNSEGFIIGTSALANSANVAYHFIAVAAGDANDFTTFTYTGNGNAQSIALPFQPELAIIKRNGASSGRWRDSVDATTSSHFFITGAGDANGITAFTSTGLDIASGSSQNGDKYYGFAFRDSGNGIFKSSSYTGDGLDDRSITGVGFQPAWVMLKNSTNATNTATRHRFETFKTNTSSALSNSAITGADTIQAMEVDGFQVGTVIDANESAKVIHYSALKKHRSRILAGAAILVTTSFSLLLQSGSKILLENGARLLGMS